MFSLQSLKTFLVLNTSKSPVYSKEDYFHRWFQKLSNEFVLPSMSKHLLIC